MTGETTKTSQFRRYAEDCMKMVADARTPEQRALLLDMAQRWLELAEQTSRIQGLIDQGLVDPNLTSRQLDDRDTQ